MLTAEMDAMATWPNQARLQALVKMNYLADVDPWLVHMTFVVADVRYDLEVERTALFFTHGEVEGPGHWLNIPGCPFRLAFDQDFVRMRLTNDGTWVDFDVRRPDLHVFLGKTAKAASYTEEKAALERYIEDGLKELG